MYLGVDFLDSLVRDNKKALDSNSVVETSMLPYRSDGSTNPAYGWTRIKTTFQALFSLNALIHRMPTLLLQGQDRPNRLDNGFNPARDFARAIAAEGPGAMFEQKLTSLRRRLEPPMGIHCADGALAPESDLFSIFLEIAADQDVEVIVLTNPFHEWFWELIRERQLMDDYASWRIEIRRRADSATGTV